MNDFSVFMQFITLLIYLGFFLAIRISQMRQVVKLKQLDEEYSLLVRLYWQQPLASKQANQWLFAILVIPLLLLFSFMLLGTMLAGEPDSSHSTFSLFAPLIMILWCSQIRGPGYFYISPRGLYWSQAMTLAHLFGGEFFPWDKIIRYRWKTNLGSNYFCFTNDRTDKQFKLETQLGPFTAEQRAEMVAALGLRTAEFHPAAEHAEVCQETRGRESGKPGS
jgi:hypothetical protein